MSTSSNHTKAFFQCCHGKHTVASSRTLLSDHVYSIHDLCVLCIPGEWLHTLAEICQSSYVIIMNLCYRLEINSVCMNVYCTENVCQIWDCSIQRANWNVICWNCCCWFMGIELYLKRNIFLWWCVTINLCTLATFDACGFVFAVWTIKLEPLICDRAWNIEDSYVTQN